MFFKLNPLSTEGPNLSMTVVEPSDRISNWQSFTGIIHYLYKAKLLVAQSAGAVEYTDCFSAEG